MAYGIARAGIRVVDDRFATATSVHPDDAAIHQGYGPGTTQRSGNVALTLEQTCAAHAMVTRAGLAAALTDVQRGRGLDVSTLACFVSHLVGEMRGDRAAMMAGALRLIAETLDEQAGAGERP